jgi:8-oxo-dGTP diphosphatase
MPHIGVGVQAIVTMRRDRTLVLLGKRNGIYGHGQWALPGGHLEFGESFERAIRRELAEETGIRAEAVEYLKSINTPFLDTEVATHYVQIGMQVLSYTGSPANLEPQRCSELGWFSLDAPMPQPFFRPSQPFVELIRDRRHKAKSAERSPRLSIYMHCMDLEVNVDKYVSYDLLADVPVLVQRFGKCGERASRQVRVNTPNTLNEGIDFLRKEIKKRLSHGYDVADITGSLGIDLAYSLFPAGAVAFRSTQALRSAVDAGNGGHAHLAQRAGGLFEDHYEQPTLFDILLQGT